MTVVKGSGFYLICLEILIPRIDLMPNLLPKGLVPFLFSSAHPLSCAMTPPYMIFLPTSQFFFFIFIFWVSSSFWSIEVEQFQHLTRAPEAALQ